jgi:hypothetical protein
MARYGLADPSAGMGAGTFSDPTLQQLYDTTVATGTSADHALDAVEHFEEHNLATLRAAASHTSQADLVTMYTNLEKASASHVDACHNAGGCHNSGAHH